MEGYVCTVAGGNGGVGKTTTAINVAVTLAERGYEVAVIDADLGMPNVGEMLGVEYEQALHDILAGESTVSETLVTAPGDVTIIPGEPTLDAYASANPKKLRKVVGTVRRAYDIVFVDTAAGLREENNVLLELADGVVLTTIPGHVSLTDTDKTRQLAELVDSEIVGALIVKATRDIRMRDIDAEFDFPVLGGIPHDMEAAGDEPMVLESPDSEAATAFQQLGEQLERVIVDGESGEDVTLVPHEWYD